MKYYFSKTVELAFDEAIIRVTEELKKEGFGVLTEINVKQTLKNKLDVNLNNYQILGACHPQSAYKALQAESNIGVFLPCNVVVKQNDDGAVEVVAVSPKASMMAVENKELAQVADEVEEKLKKVIEAV